MIGVREAARIKGCDTQTVYNAIRSGSLPASKPRGRWEIDPLELARWKVNPAHRPSRGKRRRMRLQITLTKDRLRILERAARPGESQQQVLERLAFDRCRSCARCPRCGESRRVES